MTRFIAIKTHYDKRPQLPVHLKYSTLPTQTEYIDYITLFKEEGIGGNGFHECLNFSIPEDPTKNVHIYIPPTCLPAKGLSDEDFIIFSFTYKNDTVLPARIVGVHAGVKIVSLENGGIRRPVHEQILGIEEPLHYHAESPPHLTTLFVTPIEYDNLAGIYTPVYSKWGYGLRYLEKSHAASIIKSAYDAAIKTLPSASISAREVIIRQLQVLSNINSHYSLNIIEHKNQKTHRSNHAEPSPENGKIGESFVYRTEVEYVKSKGKPVNSVEWVSQNAPTSPFDIKTIRPRNGIFEDHFIEVKTTTTINDPNIYISSYQLDFMREHPESSSVFLVGLDSEKNPQLLETYSIKDFEKSFDLTPIKYKAIKKV
jgi:hypothetical protein